MPDEAKPGRLGPVPSITDFLRADDPREWEGDVHTLIVHSVDDPVSQSDPGELEYDLEHAPSCKQEDCGYDGKTVTAWTCDVAENEGDVGLAWSLWYSGTPITEPGTYRIRSWGRKYSTEIGDEYDSGVVVVPEENKSA